jgi:hypothetical protein
LQSLHADDLLRNAVRRGRPVAPKAVPGICCSDRVGGLGPWTGSR